MLSDVWERVSRLTADDLSAVASLIAATGAIIAGIYAARSFSKLRDQVDMQAQELKEASKENEIRLLQSLTEVSDRVYAARAKHLLDEKILTISKLTDDDKSVIDTGPMLVSLDRYKRIKVDKQSDPGLRDESLLYVDVGKVKLNQAMYEGYAKIIFNRCSADVLNTRSTYRANVTAMYNQYGEMEIELGLLADRARLLHLPVGQAYEDWFQYNDYPTGKVIRQKYKIMKLEEGINTATVQVDLSRRIQVNNDVEKSFLLDGSIIHRLNKDGFPEVTGDYDPMG